MNRLIALLCLVAFPLCAQTRMQFERIGYEQGLPHLSVNKIFQDSMGFMWFSTIDGLCRYDGSTCKVFKHDDADSTSLPHNETSVFLPLPDGMFIVSTSFHAALYNPLTETFSLVSDMSALLTSDLYIHISPFFIADNDSVWRFNHFDRSIARRLKDGATKTYRNLFPSEDMLTFYALQLHDEKLWFGTSIGLFVFDINAETMHLYQNDLDNPASIPENSVRHIYVDREKNVWIATYGGGVARVILKPRPFKTFSHSPNNPNSVAGGLLFGICEDKEGNLWIGSEHDGISEFRRREDRFITHLFDSRNPNSPKTNRYRAVFCDSDGKIWANGSVFDPKTRHWHRLPIVPKPNEDRAYLEVGDTVYVFDGQRMHAVHRRSLTLNTSEMPLRDSLNAFRHCYRDCDGRALVSTINGFAELDLPTRSLNNWRLVNPNEDATRKVVHYGHVQCIYQTKDKRYWVGTRGGGLFIFSEKFETVENLNSRNGFPDNVIYNICEDDEGMLWMTTNKGLLKFNPNQKKCERVFTMADGLPNNEFNQYCFAQLRTGEIAGGGIGGFAIFNPKDLNAKIGDISVALTDFKVFEESQPMDTSMLFKQSISLNYHQNFFSFAFAAPTYANPKAIEYAYRLDGIDADWIETRATVARYNSVPHGEYLFRVKARLHNGEWSKERVAHLHIAPPFWRTSWFVGGMAVGLVTLIVVAVRAIINRRVRMEVAEVKRQEELKLAKEVAILAERERIAADVHDDVGATLTKIVMLAEALKQNAQSVSPEMLVRLANSAREATASVSEIVWSMNPRYDSLDTFAAYLREKSRQLFEASSIELRIDFPDDLPNLVLSGETRHNLFLAVKESLNNALKHSGASNVCLSLSLVQTQLTIVVQDNGQGIDQERLFGNGLHTMQKRMETIGGLCDVRSEKGVGTRAQFQICLKPEPANGKSA